MNGFSLKNRAIVSALWAGAIVFILALAAASLESLSIGSAVRALLLAIVCGVLCWASVERALARTAASLDVAIGRLSRAANGDLESDIPDEVQRNVPQLAQAMDGLFAQLHSNFESVQRLAMFDPVTALANRTSFRRSAERVLAQLPPEQTAVLYFIDLDRFKAVNDTLGHAGGDALLGLVANRLRVVGSQFADIFGTGAPLIGRLAGDEFTMLFAGIDGTEDADRIGRGILYALSECFDVADQEVSVGASIGVVMRRSSGGTLHDLMRAADVAMYRAKALGRGQVAHFSAALAAELAERELLEQELRAAVAQQQFVLVYQPQVSVVGGQVVAVEALLRWRRSDDSLWLPIAFLERAEETGLIVEIGEWVLRNVAETLGRWGALGIEQRLAVNVSQRQIDHAAFFRRLRAALRTAGAPAHLLELEINETLAANCSDEVLEAIKALRTDGATISIDAFGTGYSNLARLRELPIDRIKLHRSVTSDVARQEDSRAIAQAMINLVHGLGCEVVAEGVEDDQQATVLRVLGCDVLQGYGIAAPMEEASFLHWIDESRQRRIAS